MGWDLWNWINVLGYNVFYKEIYLRFYIKLVLKMFFIF